jgi:hypothetical protein
LVNALVVEVVNAQSRNMPGIASCDFRFTTRFGQMSYLA